MTGRRESGCRVFGIVRHLVVRLVAAVAVDRETRIVVVHMATGARNRCMSAGKRKRSVVMIKRALAPSDGVVARVAVRRKTELNVVNRRDGIVVVGLMASNASCARQPVVVIKVAGSASHAHVRASQRKAS